MSDALHTRRPLAGGRLLERLAEALIEVSTDVASIGQPGAVTLKLSIKRVGDGTPEVIIEEAITKTAPKRKPRGAILFVVDGDLYQDDPRQPRMQGFEVVESGAGAVRDIDSQPHITREA